MIILLALAAQTFVLAHPVSRGAILSSNDFIEAAADARPPTPGWIEPAAAIGMEARRSLMAGAVVRPNDIAPVRLVKRGEPVTIRLRSGGMTITAAGRALADGRSGDSVRVVTNGTSRTIDGVVESAGTVRIAFAD